MPVVTIITPCFNHGKTLPMALASLLAQSLFDWECLVVDDGSSQRVDHIVDAFHDTRIRYLALESNQGRGAARQIALDMADSQFVCMLDADDWYYPEKLDRQIAILESNPEWVAVSSSMAVIDNRDDLIGVRHVGYTVKGDDSDILGGFNRIAFPPIMIRTKIAQSETFDSSLERSEDFDYLIRVLDRRSYGVMRWVGYAYREEFSARSMGEALSAFRCQRRVFGKYLGEYPVEVGRQYLWNLLKTGLYTGAKELRRGEWLFERRNQPASASQIREFESARRICQDICRDVFGTAELDGIS